jgi:hypothetical protein
VIGPLISQIRGGGGGFFNFLIFFDDPKIKPVYALEPCKYRGHPLAYLNKEEMVNLDLGLKLDDILHDLVILQA